MSNDVYFNEPGYEGSKGTAEGDKKNLAYSNVVKYANIVHAMTDYIKNPPQEFKDVILRHFYLKKEQILKEVQTWIGQSNQTANYHYTIFGVW